MYGYVLRCYLIEFPGIGALSGGGGDGPLYPPRLDGIFFVKDLTNGKSTILKFAPARHPPPPNHEFSCTPLFTGGVERGPLSAWAALPACISAYSIITSNYGVLSENSTSCKFLVID